MPESPLGIPACAEYVTKWFKQLGRIFLMFVKLTEWSHCARSAFACMLSVYTHSPLSQKPALVSRVCTAWHLWKTPYKIPAHLWIGCSSDVKVFLVWAAEAGWVGGSPACVYPAVLNPADPWAQAMPAQCRPGAAFIQKIVLEGKTLPPFVLCSWDLIRIWHPVFLTPPSILKAFQSAVWCPGFWEHYPGVFLLDLDGRNGQIH